MSSDFWFTVTKITRHPMFDIVVACIIFLNTIAMAIEAQWQGLSVGASINFGKIDAGHVASWTSAEQSFVWIGYAFGFVYVLELMLKLAGQRRSFFKQLARSPISYFASYTHFRTFHKTAAYSP